MKLMHLLMAITTLHWSKTLNPRPEWMQHSYFSIFLSSIKSIKRVEADYHQGKDSHNRSHPDWVSVATTPSALLGSQDAL